MLIIVRGNIQYNIPNILGYIVPDIVGYMLNRTGQVSWTGRGSSEKKLIGNIVPIVYQILMETVPGPSELDWEQYFWKKLIGKILKNIFSNIILYIFGYNVVQVKWVSCGVDLLREYCEKCWICCSKFCSEYYWKYCPEYCWIVAQVKWVRLGVGLLKEADWKYCPEYCAHGFIPLALVDTYL